jgi:hypothetical protein
MSLRMRWVTRLTTTTCQSYVLLERSPAPECYRICRCSTSPSHPPWGVRSLQRKRMGKAWAISREEWEMKDTLWIKDRLVVPKKEALKKKILDEAHTSRYSIHLGSTKMYHDLRQQFGGQEWNVRQLAMCQNVIPARRLKPTIWSLEGCCNHWVFQIRSGMTFAWISLWDCHWLPTSLIRFGCSWIMINSPNPLTSYTLTPTTMFTSMPRSTLLLCYSCTEFRRRSSIEGHSLLLTFGSNCTRPSELTWSTVWPIIHIRTAKLNE